MSEFFLKIINMSISGGWTVLAVFLLRLLLKKAPKWIAVLLWGIVGIRLLFPISIESIFSLIPSAETFTERTISGPSFNVQTGISPIDTRVNDYLSSRYFEGVTVPANNGANTITILSVVWVIGIIALLAYVVFSYRRLCRKVETAVLLRDNIFQSENVFSPFILGVVRPKIYLPFGLSEQNAQCVIAHEQAHISRKDHWWKPIGFLILTIHWFNPLIWLGYVLLCRDIELACDEKVVKEWNTEQRADYSQALLTCSVNRRMISASPLAFGEVGVKNRVKSVLNYKKPAFWIILIAIAASIAAGVCFLTNPKTSISDELAVFFDGQIAEYHLCENSKSNYAVMDYEILGIDETSDKVTAYMWVLYEEYLCENGEIKLESGSHTPTIITAKRTGLHGHYELIEYWQPRDGSYYAEDIKNRFPWYLEGKALDPQRYIDKQKANCEKLAKEYYSSKGLLKSDVTVTGSGSTAPGISISLIEANLSADPPYLKVEWKNDTPDEYIYGEEFDILYRKNGVFKSCAPQNIYFNSIGNILPINGRYIKTYYVSEFDMSKKGTYRFETGYGESKQWFDFEIDVSDVGGAVNSNNAIVNPYEYPLVYSYSSENDSSELALDPQNKKFTLILSVLSSYFSVGTYEETDNFITAHTDDGAYTYTFEKNGQNLIFAADKSSPLPSYSYSHGDEPKPCVADGANFKLKTS